MTAGNIGDLGIGIQAVKGTASATAIQKLMLTGGGIAQNPEFADYEETTGKTVRAGAYIARTAVAGQPSGYARPQSLGPLLYGVFGSKAVTGAGDPYTHTFTIASILPYLTFWKNVGAVLYERFHDCKLSQLVLRSSEGAPLTVEATIVGLSGRYQAADDITGVAVDVTIPFIHHDASSALKIAGTAISYISSVTLTIATGAQAVRGDSLEGYTVDEGVRSIMFETDQYLADLATWNAVHYGSASPADDASPTRTVQVLAGSPLGIDMKWTEPGGPPARSLEILATNVSVKAIAGVDTNTSGDPLRQQVTYQAYQPAGGGTAATAILVNGTATYTAN